LVTEGVEAETHSYLSSDIGVTPEETSRGELLTVTSVSKSFGGFKAVDDVTLRIDAGECLTILGPNGAGKSTLFALIGGQLRPDAGRVMFAHRDVTRWPANRISKLGLSRTFQVARTFSTFTVRDNLRVALSAATGLKSMSLVGRLLLNSEDEDRVSEALTIAGLERIGNRLSGDIGEGDRKRLDIARVLVQPSKLLLLDEPTAGLSAGDTTRMIELIRVVRVRHPELGLMLTAHDMNVVREVSDRALLLARGRVIAEGLPDEVLNSSVARESYLGDE
jgi:branched-chain amino acid transport system ATP-binding protein